MSIFAAIRRIKKNKMRFYAIYIVMLEIKKGFLFCAPIFLFTPNLKQTYKYQNIFGLNIVPQFGVDTKVHTTIN